MNSWADIVKFGQAKVQRAAPTAKCQTVTKKTVKKVPKPQTPARRLKDLALASTGHANSPATIVVGRAVKQRVVYDTGAAPRVVMNTALSKKDMKMDEDMTGISEMFKTPVHERKRSVSSEKNVLKTPVVDLSRSMVEPSILNTPEEPGQMTVSPLTVKVTRYNSEAVQRLLNGDEEATFVGDIPPLEINSDSSELQPSDVSTHAPTTPNQKIELSECFTGVKRIMKTPKQQSEPVEDLRGKLLKTPKLRPEPKECLTGVKRIMKTPKLKAEPVEDIRGNLLKTPKQKTEQQECLTGIKRVMKTPRQKSEPVEDIRGNLLKTPKQKPEQKECLSGVKQIFNIPQWEEEPLEEGRLDAKEVVETPKFMQESDNLSDETAKKTESSPSVLLSGIKTMTKTPKEKSTPVEDMVGLKRLMKTPKEKSEPVEKNFGIKRLMKSPRLRGVAPVEDFEGLEELMKEPLSTPAGHEKAVEIEEQMLLDCDSAIGKELDLVEDPHDDADMAKADPTEAIGDIKSEEVHVETGPSDAMDTVSESVVDDGSSKDQVEMEADEVMPSEAEETTTDSMETITQAPTAESLALETATSKVTEIDEAVIILDVQKKSVRGRRTKVTESKAAADDDKQQVTPSEDPVVPAPVRGRRGRKTEAPAPPAVRKTTRGRNAKTTEPKDDGLTEEESAPVPAVKPKRGNAKKATEEQTETVQEVPAETEEAPEDKQTSQIHADHEANEVQHQEKPVLKRGKKSKQASVPQPDMSEDANEVVPPKGEENTMDATETEAPEVKTETFKVTEGEEAVVIPDAQKKPARGRRTKVVESKVIDVEQEVASEEPVVPAPVRGRRGRKTEAPAPPAVRQTTRGRNAKVQEGPSDEKPEKVPENSVQTQMVIDLSAEDADDQPSAVNASHVDDGPAPPEEKSTLKPKRGRKTKPAPVEAPQLEPESTEVVSEQHVLEDVQPEPPVPAVDKPKRGGRKMKPDAGKQNEKTEDTVVPEETNQVSQPPARPKRGRNAKEEEKPENNEPTLTAETQKSHEPANKRRRTRRAELEPEEPSEVPTVKIVTSEEMVASIPAQPEEISQATQVPKPRRGARKAQESESVTPVESTEVQEVPVVSSTDKPKRGRRGKPSAEEPSVTEAVAEEKPEHKPETEEQTNTESTHAVKPKPSRARGGKTSTRNEASESVPAKRARRSAAVPVEESSVEVPDVVPEPAPLPVEPVKRGRRAAPKAKANTEETVSSDQVNSTEESRNADQDKKSKRSVKWKADFEVFEVTPLKTIRGRKAKSGDQKDIESNSVSKSATKTEEEDLSDQKSQPVKRARRGAKVPDITEESTNKLPEEDQVISKKDEAEAQPKTRRGRSAKK